MSLSLVQVQVATGVGGATIEAFYYLDSVTGAYYPAPVLYDPNGVMTPLAKDATLQSLVGGAAKFNNEAVGAASALPATGSTTFTGATRDVGVAAGSTFRLAYFNAFFLADQSGIAYVDGSNDSVNFFTTAPPAPFTASTALIITVPVMTRYHRARFLNNSGVAQTLLWINTSYTGG